MRRQLLEYYKTVQDYHRIAEESHASEMVSADLLLQYVDRTGLILDVAGGTGFNAEFLKIPASHYICADLSILGLSIAKEKNRGSVVLTDAANLPIRNDSVGVVLCSWSFEHFPNPEEILTEMIRVVRPGGRIVIWGPNWDNIFRINFPQFDHEPKSYAEKVRWRIFLQMIRNEFLPFRYKPYVNLNVAALAQPEKYVSWDSDAVHCALCQETYKWFKKKGCTIVHISDFAEVPSTIRNDLLTRLARRILTPLLPLLRRIPLLRWFIIRFPIVIEAPETKS